MNSSIRKRRSRFNAAAFTLIETLIAMLIVMAGSMATISMLSAAQVNSSIEQERSRAHQIVSEEMERLRLQLYSLVSAGQQVTVWDNGTPDDATDDTNGTLEVEIRDADTNATLAAAPNPAKRVLVEVTLTWNPRGRLGGKTMRETVMTYLSP